MFRDKHRTLEPEYKLTTKVGLLLGHSDSPSSPDCTVIPFILLLILGIGCAVNPKRC